MTDVVWTGWPHVTETQQFDTETLEHLCAHADAFEDALREARTLPRRSAPTPRKLLLLFYEPSTRTYKTFWDAGHALGFTIPPMEHPEAFSSAVKGESLTDAIAALTHVGGMGSISGADIVVLRHPELGAAQSVADVLTIVAREAGKPFPIPVLNAGDGTGQHPTQALVDLATIFRERRRDGHPLDDLVIVLSGDLRYGRTVNSLLYLLGKFGERHRITVVLSSHPDLAPKEGILEYLGRHNMRVETEPDFLSAVARADVVYMTRIQRERIPSPDEYRRVKGAYVFTTEHLGLLKAGAFVMHPLPINRDPADPPAEIDDQLTHLALQGDPRCAWFRQSHRGFPVRAALLDLICARMDTLQPS